MKGLPQVLDRTDSGDRLVLALQVDAACPWFEGHFPGAPILPGVVQVGWAATFAEQWLNLDDPPMIIERVKFRHPITPDSRLDLVLTSLHGSVGYEFRLADNGICASSGRLVYVNPSS